MYETELLLNKVFYGDDLIKKGIQDFKNGDILIEDAGRHLKLKFKSSEKNTHLEFCNYLLFLLKTK